MIRCLNLSDIHVESEKMGLDHLTRVDHLYIGSKINSSEQVDYLKSLDIKTVIDLKSCDETTFNDEQVFKEAGLKYFNLPISNLADLKFDDLKELSDLINDGQHKTLIYCGSGNRAGAILALSSCLICGHPKQRAIDFGLKVGIKSSETKDLIIKILEKGQLS